MTLKVATLQGTVAVPLIRHAALTTATTTASAAKARVPCAGRIVGVTPVYGNLSGSTPFTDIDAMIENGTTDLFTANHALVDSSADTTDEPTLDDDQRTVAEGDILHLDLITTGGSSPTSQGYGYVVHILPA